MIRRAEKPCCHDSFMVFFGSCWSIPAPILSTFVFHVVEWHEGWVNNDITWSFGRTIPFIYFPQINWTSCPALRLSDVRCDQEFSMALTVIAENDAIRGKLKNAHSVWMARFLSSALMRLKDIFLSSCRDCNAHTHALMSH